MKENQRCRYPRAHMSMCWFGGLLEKTLTSSHGREPPVRHPGTLAVIPCGPGPQVENPGLVLKSWTSARGTEPSQSPGPSAAPILMRPQVGDFCVTSTRCPRSLPRKVHNTGKQAQPQHVPTACCIEGPPVELVFLCCAPFSVGDFCVTSTRCPRSLPEVRGLDLEFRKTDSWFGTTAWVPGPRTGGPRPWPEARGLGRRSRNSDRR